MGIRVDLVNWNEGLNLLKNLDPNIMQYQIEAPLKEIGNLAMKVAGRSFKTKRSPDGKSWAPISPSTYRFGKPTSSPPLVNTGAMRRGLSFSILRYSQKRELVIGTNKPYWWKHQFGHPTNKLPGIGITAPIPARPFLGFGRADLVRVERITRTWLDRYSGKRGRKIRRGKAPVSL